MNMQEALTVAMGILSEVNYYEEYEKCFVFGFDDGNEYDGGEYDPVVVQKDGSGHVPYVIAIQKGLFDGDLLKAGDIPED